MAKTGLVVESNAGFYYCREDDGTITQCRARGKFREKRVSPLVGDTVEFSLTENGNGVVEKIRERKSFFLRPPVANADKLIIVSSVLEPQPNTYVIDKMTASAVLRNVEPVVVFSKSDLASCTPFVELYEKIGIVSFGVSSKTGENLDEFKRLFDKNICVLTGNTGVGKSSLINAIDENALIDTGEISKKLGRGRHTTRTTKLYEFGGGFIADTPGFSSVESLDATKISKDVLPECFPEFRQYLGQCKFVSCHHIGEKGCKICEAVQNNLIPKSRYDSYVRMYDEVKDIKDWEESKLNG